MRRSTWKVLIALAVILIVIPIVALLIELFLRAFIGTGFPFRDEEAAIGLAMCTFLAGLVLLFVVGPQQIDLKDENDYRVTDYYNPDNEDD